MGLIDSLSKSGLRSMLLLLPLAFMGARHARAQQVVPLTDGPSDTPRSIPQRHDLSYEDWRKPALPSGMQPDIEVLDRYEGKSFRRELLHAQWRELDPIDLIVIRPTSAKKTPVILYLYSYPSSNDRYMDPKFCEFLTRNGVAAVGFVSALTGQRFHDRPMKEWFVSQLPESLGTTVHDVQMILNYLAARGDMDMDHVGMWGDGSGAAIAIMAAATDPRIKALDLLDPWGDWPNWLAKSTLVPEKEREQYLTPDFLVALDELEPLKALPQLKIPVRIQHIEGITVTPALVRQHIEAAAPQRTEIVHHASSKEFVANVVASGKSFAWIENKIAPPAEHPSDSRSARAEAPK